MSVTAAGARGVAGLVADAERGEDTIIERHGRAVAAVISFQHFAELNNLRVDLTAAGLVLARELTDTGRRTDLDDAIVAFGFDRADLETELETDLETERETEAEVELEAEAEVDADIDIDIAAGREDSRA